MKFSFAIANSSLYDSESHARTRVLINSIREQKIPDYEIVCCGDFICQDSDVRCIQIEGDDKNPISKKLNRMVEESTGDIVILIRDYMQLLPGWHKGFEKFGYDWDLAMCVIMNKDKTRFRDWCVWSGDDEFPNDSWVQIEPWCKDGKIVPGRTYLPAYTYSDIKRMYISGGLYIGKRDWLIRHTWGEDLKLFEAEDVNWYQRHVALQQVKYRMNRFSAIQLQKEKDTAIPYLHPHFGTYEYISKDLILE